MVETNNSDSVLVFLARNNNSAAYYGDASLTVDENTTSDKVDVTLALEGNVTCVDSEEWLGVDIVTLLLDGCLLPVVAITGLAG